MWQPKRYYSEDLFEGDPIIYLEDIDKNGTNPESKEEDGKAILNKDK